jgi:hypothetical protein
MDLFEKSLCSFLQVGGGVFAAFLRHVERNFLSFFQGAHTSFFNCTDVHKHIGAAVIGLDETETFLIIKPFNCTLGHFRLLHFFSFCTCVRWLDLGDIAEFCQNIYKNFFGDIAVLRQIGRGVKCYVLWLFWAALALFGGVFGQNALQRAAMHFQLAGGF